VRSNRDFPQILVNSIPAPELVQEEVSEEDLAYYEAGLRELDSLRVDFIVMVCNTIHLFHSKLQAKVKAPILDLRREVGARLKREGIRQITVLGTPATVRGHLYSFAGIECLNPSRAELLRLGAAIREFNLGRDKQKHAASTASLARKYLRAGSEKIILGCTELALMLRGEGLPVLDTLDVLAEAAIEEMLKTKKTR
jgi:aspartate racemase